MASNDLLAAILGTDSGELNAARARVLASKGNGDINLAANIERGVKRAPLIVKIITFRHLPFKP